MTSLFSDALPYCRRGRRDDSRRLRPLQAEVSRGNNLGQMYRDYFVYIMTNRPNGVLYVGVTNDIYRRTREHRELRGCGFSRKYKLTRLVYFEGWQSPSEAIAREKQIKGGSRKTKLRLIEEMNPSWSDLFEHINDFV